MSLLREIYNDAANPQVDVTTVLRKCKILAARLGSEEFARWNDWELGGYPEGQPVPDYRKLGANAYGHFVNPAWQINRAAISRFTMPEWARERVDSRDFREGIAKAESFARDGAIIEWPELGVMVQGKMYPGMTCMRAWLEISPSEIQQLISAVRNRIIDFALKIEVENPNAGEAPPNSQPVAPDKLQPLVNYFFSPIGSIAQGSHEFSQAANVSSQAGDFESLKAILLRSGVPQTDIEELEKAVQEDRQHPERGAERPGRRVLEWLGKASMKCASGAWDVGKGISIQVVSALMKDYFGMP